MKLVKLLALWLAVLIIVAPAAAQGLPQTLATEAEALSRLVQAPDNLSARFRVLALHANDLKTDLEVQQWLAFFSDTRTVFWSSSVSTPAVTKMVEFEQSSVKFAAERGINLDLPPMGVSPLGANDGGTVTQFTREGLVNSTLLAEQLSTELLAQRSSPPLLRLQQALTGARVALQEGADADARLQQVMVDRARFLLEVQPSDYPAGLVDRLDAQLNQVVTAAHQLSPASFDH